MCKHWGLHISTNIDRLEVVTGIDRKVFLRALSWLWDCGNRRRIGGDMTEWSLWHNSSIFMWSSSISSFFPQFSLLFITHLTIFSSSKVTIFFSLLSWLGKIAKSLFIFLFFSFLFLFLWTYNYKVERGKVSHDFVTMSQWCDGWSCHSHSRKVSHD